MFASEGSQSGPERPTDPTRASRSKRYVVERITIRTDPARVLESLEQHCHLFDELLTNVDPSGQVILNAEQHRQLRQGIREMRTSIGQLRRDIR